MKIRSERDKRTYLIIALCAILVVMGVGYAAFSSLLTINGTANISNSWCVGFDNTKTSDLQITKGLSTGTTPTGSMSYSGTACGTNLVPTSSLVAHFYQPGDEIEYTLTITNKSAVTAAIKSILVDNESVTSNTAKKKDNITYIVEMPESTTLEPNASTTMKVIAKFQNETDVTGAYSGETKTIEVKINAEQDDGNGGMNIAPVSSKYTGPIYRWSYSRVQNGDAIATEIGKKWCANHPEYGNSCDFGEYFDTENDCNSFIAQMVSEGQVEEGVMDCQQKIARIKNNRIGEYTTDPSTLNKTYYLKHDVEEDIITASYVCFVYNNAEHCMKGADGGASYSANQQIIKDFQTFNNLPDNGNPGCNFYSSHSFCNGGGFYQVNAESDGSVDVYGSWSGYCNVNDDGYSDCDEW